MTGTLTTTRPLDLGNLTIDLYVANTRKEVCSALRGYSNETRLRALKEAVSLFDSEAETFIALGSTDVALMKMSQVALFEDIILVIERMMMKEGTL